MLYINLLSEEGKCNKIKAMCVVKENKIVKCKRKKGVKVIVYTEINMYKFAESCE
jgi:exonuclease VII large subunit